MQFPLRLINADPGKLANELISLIRFSSKRKSVRLVRSPKAVMSAMKFMPSTNSVRFVKLDRALILLIPVS